MSRTPNQPPWLRPELPREGRYVRGPLLGKGGMGEVLEAWDVVLCRTVALKNLRDLDPTAMIRFVHEAQIQARVVHPNICRIYDIESSDANLRIAMQLIRGPNLEQVARQLSVPEVVGILAQVAEAVHAAHRVHLIHRDLKPSNILLERHADGRWIPYICDFGLAVSMDEPALTQSQTVLGTPAYMAPEQLEGAREQVGPPTDVYALGGTLYYCLVGVPPPPPGLRDSRRTKTGLPRDLELILRTCLARDPARRYPTAAALAEDLWRFQHREPVQAWEPNRRPGLSRLPRHGRIILAAAASTLLAVTTVAAALHWADRRALLAAHDQSVTTLREMEGAVDAFHAEEALPPHDMRPARAHVKARLEALLRRMPGARDPFLRAGWYAVGRYRMALGDYRGAAQAFQQARRPGDMDEAFQRQVNEARLGALLEGLDAAAPGLVPADEPVPVSSLDPLRTLIRHAEQRDLAAAVQTLPLIPDGAIRAPQGWASHLFCALGRQRYRAGDPDGAGEAFAQAVALARQSAASWPSGAKYSHALARAALAHTEFLLEEGRPTDEGLALIHGWVHQGLRLDPSDPDLQEDFLAGHVLQARRLLLRGEDPGPEVEAALAYADTRMKEDGRPRTRAQRMLLHLTQAQFAVRRGRDPWPPLVEALRTAESGPFFLKDHLTGALLLKASLEAGQGRDPRPTLEDGLERLKQARNSWRDRESEARLWLARADYERAQGLDDRPSLDAAEAAAGEALRAFPAAPGPSAVKALALLRRMEREPGRRQSLLPAARAFARAALRGPQDPAIASRLGGLSGGTP